MSTMIDGAKLWRSIGLLIDDNICYSYKATRLQLQLFIFRISQTNASQPAGQLTLGKLYNIYLSFIVYIS